MEAVDFGSVLSLSASPVSCLTDEGSSLKSKPASKMEGGKGRRQ